MATIIKGQNLRVFIKGTSDTNPMCIAAATSCQVHFTAGTEDSSTKDDTADWGSVECVSKNWDISVDALVVLTDTGGKTATDLIGLLGEEVTVKFAQTSGDQNRTAATTSLVSGTAIITDINVTAANRQNGTYTVQMQGQGQPTFNA